MSNHLIDQWVTSLMSMVLIVIRITVIIGGMDK